LLTTKFTKDTKDFSQPRDAVMKEGVRDLRGELSFRNFGCGFAALGPSW
jgi:hypothetical protein